MDRQGSESGNSGIQSSFRLLNFHHKTSVFFSAVFSTPCLVLVTLDQFLLVILRRSFI